MLTVSNINTFYGAAHILHDISLTISRGEAVALLGRNGAGKSTLIKSIIGIVPPRSGTISFEGQEVSGLDPFVIARRGIGYVPEDRRIFVKSYRRGEPRSRSPRRAKRVGVVDA